MTKEARVVLCVHVCGRAGKSFIHTPFSFFFFFVFCQTTLFSVISICCDKATSSSSQNGPLQIMSVMPNRGAKADFTPPLRPFRPQTPLILLRYHSRHRLWRNADERGRRCSQCARRSVSCHVQSKHSFRALSIARSPGIGLKDTGGVKEVFTSVRDAFLLLDFCYHSQVMW